MVHLEEDEKITVGFYYSIFSPIYQSTPEVFMKSAMLALLITYSFFSDSASAQRGRENENIMIACAKAFTYNFQQRECVQKARSADHVLGCSLFNYDFQKFDCLEEAQAFRGGVEACIRGFNYDFQRFECLRLPVSGRRVDFCTTQYNYDFQRFDCLRQ